MTRHNPSPSPTAAAHELPDAAARFLDDVASHLAPLPAAARRAAVSDLRDLLAEGIEPAELGPANEYAATLRATLGAEGDDGDEVQARVFGIPVDIRGATSARVRSRMFDPTDPRILVPRLLGAGWSPNFGAIAVRLGLIRPDDLDADVVAHIPERVKSVTRAVPWLLAAKTAALVAVAWRSGASVPSHWNGAGRVDGWSDRRVALLPLLAISGATAWWGTRPTPSPEDRLVRAAIGAWAGATTTSIAAVTVTSAWRPDAAHPEAAMIAVAPFVTAAAMLICPVRAGVRALGRGTVEATAKDTQ